MRGDVSERGGRPCRPSGAGRLASGIDVVSISRIRGNMGNRRFLRRVFTDRELEYCMGRRRPEMHLAGRFAAKEAFFKALMGGMNHGPGWKDVEVACPLGERPNLRVHRLAQSLAEGRRLFLSISHSGDLAFAFVVVE